jgi:hypothetical protein
MKIIKNSWFNRRVPSRGAFPFLTIFSRLTSGVAKGSCGVHLMCFPLKATTKRMESPVDSHQ